MIRVLNTVIAAIGIAVDAMAKFLDRAIVAIQRVSRKIVTLLLAIFRLLFYLLPFVLFIVIGLSKNWPFLYVIGAIVLVFAAILFVRDLLVAFKEDSIEERKEEKIEHAGRVIVIIIILNILTIGYAALFYFFNISAEQLGAPVLQRWIGSLGHLFTGPDK